MSDTADLVMAARAGDRHAFARLVTDQTPIGWRPAFAILRSEVDAEVARSTLDRRARPSRPAS